MKRQLTILTAIFVLAGASGAMAQISGSAHDFSDGSVFNAGGEICLPCHAPHNADRADLGKLWNHEVTTSTFTTYDGTTTVAAATALDSNSILCVSCHDGSVALDSFGGTTGLTKLAAGDFGFLGTDLQDDHPVGNTADYSDGTANTSLNDVVTVELTLPLSTLDGQTDIVACSTCHSVHNDGGNASLLRVTNVGSALCLTCHNK